MAVSKRLRFEILRRDNHACRYCGACAPDAVLTIDHVVPVTLGGSDEPDNLVTACDGCNAGKSSTNPDRPLVEDVASDAMRWAEAMKAAAEVQQAVREADQERFERFDDFWLVWRGFNDSEIPRPDAWRDSLEQFFEAGATAEDLEYAIDVAMRAKIPATRTWKYFCGVVWRILRERQQIAQSLLAVEEAD